MTMLDSVESWSGLMESFGFKNYREQAYTPWKQPGKVTLKVDACLWKESSQNDLSDWHQALAALIGMVFGGLGRNRTADAGLFRAALYQIAEVV